MRGNNQIINKEKQQNKGEPTKSQISCIEIEWCQIDVHDNSESVYHTLKMLCCIENTGKTKE